jgi:hypothetical protein
MYEYVIHIPTVLVLQNNVYDIIEKNFVCFIVSSEKLCNIWLFRMNKFSKYKHDQDIFYFNRHSWMLFQY